MNTQQIATVETSVGTAMPAEPCRVASGSGIVLLGQQPMRVLDRHRRIVDQDADREREAAKRHRVQRVRRGRRA